MHDQIVIAYIQAANDERSMWLLKEPAAYSPVSIGRSCRGTELLFGFHFDSE